MEDYELSRFGPPVVKDVDEASSIPAEKEYQTIRATLDDPILGFEVYEEENESWVGFRHGNTEYAAESWDRLDLEESLAVRAGVPFSEEMRQKMLESYKINIDIPPERIKDLFRLLAETLPEGDYIGKFGKGNILSSENFPKVVLYLRGSKTADVMDFTIALAKLVKYRLGGSDAQLVSAKDVEPGSGVFLSQGTYGHKEMAQELGNHDDYYGPDSALFKENEEKYQIYRKRRENQMKIEETLVNYVGIPTPSERLIELQRDAFEGIWSSPQLGIRQVGVRVSGVTDESDYIAPTSKSLRDLLHSSDTRILGLMGEPPYEEIGKPAYEVWAHESRFHQDYDYAVRTAAAAYLLNILIHPFEDGNGQSTKNLISSLLFEGGHRKAYLGVSFEEFALKAKAFGDIQTKEAPTPKRITKASDPERHARNMQRVLADHKESWSVQFLNHVLGDECWAQVKSFVDSGEIPDLVDINLTDDERLALGSFMTRLNEINQMLQRDLSENPIGSPNLTVTELQRAQEMALGR